MSPIGKKDVPDFGDDESLDLSDSLALNESQALANDEDLEEIARRADHSRRESFKNHFHRALIILFWTFFLGLMTAGGLWAFHLLTPEKWHFLNDAQLSEIKSTFFTGVLSSGLSIAVKSKYFSN